MLSAEIKIKIWTEVYSSFTSAEPLKGKSFYAWVIGCTIKWNPLFSIMNPFPLCLIFLIHFIKECYFEIRMFAILIFLLFYKQG